MAQRLIQVFIPDRAHVEIETLLDGRPYLGIWQDSREPGRKTLELLVEADKAEPLLDRFEEEFKGVEGYACVLLPVEAVLPRPEPEEPQKDDEDADDEEKKAERAGRVSREELHTELSESLPLNRVYFAMIALSVIVAAVGLHRDDVAILIGAMVIAPLLGPNMAMSLALTLGDIDLLKRAAITNLAGIAPALGLSVLMGVLWKIDPTVPALVDRSSVGMSDLALALAAGSAGTFAFTRDQASAVIGVMVAVALVPPLVAFGMLLGGGHFALAVGAGLLVLANVICVNLAGIATFAAQGVRPRSWWEEKRAKRMSRVAVAFWLALLAALGAVIWITAGPETLP